jgi:hypothetical protein
MIIVLPRQARDKHRESSTQKETLAFSWTVRRAALKRRQHFGGVLVPAGTQVTELGDDSAASAVRYYMFNYSPLMQSYYCVHLLSKDC